MATEELRVLELVSTRLEAAGIAYMLSGSMAMNYYAQPRMTRDIDIVVELDLAGVDRLASLFVSDCYCDVDMIREAVRHQGMFNIIHDATVVKVDFVVRKDSPYRRCEFDRRRRVSVADVSLWMVTAEDLILSKLVWAKDTNSSLQMGDVRNLVTTVPELDWGYLERWAEGLSVASLLAKVRQ